MQHVAAAAEVGREKREHFPLVMRQPQCCCGCCGMLDGLMDWEGWMEGIGGYGNHGCGHRCNTRRREKSVIWSVVGNTTINGPTPTDISKLNNQIVMS